MPWYYYTPSGKMGPYTVTELKTHAMNGLLRPEMIVENGQGLQALADTVTGLTFPLVTSVPSVPPVSGTVPPVPPAPPVPAGNTQNYTLPPAPPIPGMEPQTASIPYPPANQKNVHSEENSAPNSSKNLIFSIWDFDLSPYFKYSEEVNENLVKNAVNVLTLYWRIYSFFYWLAVIISLFACIGGGITQLSDGGIGWIVLGVIEIPVAILFYFLCRILFKLPIELYIKLPIRLLKLMEEIEKKLPEETVKKEESPQ